MPKLLDRLRNADALPSPPGVALEIIRLNQRDDVDLEDLCRIVERDPAIVAKLFRMANASASGASGEITDIRQAIITLGLRAVNLLALSFSVVSTASGKSTIGFDYPSYWTSSVVITTAARCLVARHFPELKHEAFLAGLLCNFSQLLLAECLPREYGSVIKRQSRRGGRIEEIEDALLGANHAEIGGALLGDWGLPSVVTTAIAFHHDADAAQDVPVEAQQLARILEVASACSEIYVGGNLEADLNRLAELGGRHFDMRAEDCKELLEEIDERVPELVELLALEQLDPVRMADIRVQATEYLVRESLALNQQMQTVTSAAERLKIENDALEARATTDPLTGLRNRGFFDEMLLGELERAAQSGHALGLLLLDIDHFKSVNDTYGHQVGDEMLRLLARVVEDEARTIDHVCRYGGEEIAVICPDVDLPGLRTLAERMRVAVARSTLEVARAPVRRTISVGGCLASVPVDPARSARIVEVADEELYRAKSDGRDRSCCKPL